MKFRLLHFGALTADEGFFFHGGGTSTISAPNPDATRREVTMMGGLIEHPDAGVILWDCGPIATHKEVWPAPVQEVFGITTYEEENTLPNQLEKAGYSISDVSAIIISHLHLDHAGGLEHFRGTDVPIYVHEEELKHAFYGVATKVDFGAYLPDYLDPNLNWKAVHGSEAQLFEGITVYHTPGHTPGLLVLQLDLKNSGTFLFPSDLFFFKQNYEGDGSAMGWLLSDMKAWHEALYKVKQLEARNNAKILFSHDAETLKTFTAVYD